MIRKPILRAALCYPAERSLTSHGTLFSIPCAALQYKVIIDCFLLGSRIGDTKECSVGCESALRGITKRGLQERLQDHKKGLPL